MVHQLYFIQINVMRYVMLWYGMLTLKVLNF